MTGAEREDFRELRAELRSGFADIKDSVTSLAGRVQLLEIERDVRTALEGERKKTAEVNQADRRYRFGIVLGIASSIGLGLLNLLAK